MKDLIIKVFTIGLLKGIGVICALITQILLARFLSNELFGKFYFLFTLLNLLAILGMIGLNSSILKVLPTLTRAEKNSFICMTLKLILLSSIIISVMFYTYCFYFENDNELSIVLTAIIPLLILLLFFEALLKANELAVMSQFCRSFFLPFLFLLVIYCFGGGSNVNTYFLKYMLSIFLCVLLSLFVLCKRIEIKKVIFKTSSFSSSKSFIKTSIVIYFSSLLLLTIGQTSLFVGKFYLPYKDIGFYGVAVQISTSVSLFLTFINVIITPKISVKYKNCDIKGINNLLAQSSFISFGLAISLSLFLMFCGKQLLEVYGTSFSLAYIPMLILLCGQIINSFCGPVAQVMFMTNYHKEALVILIITEVVSICFASFLIMRYGLIGAAISTSLSMVMWNLIMVCFLRIKEDIKSDALFFIKKATDYLFLNRLRS